LSCSRARSGRQIRLHPGNAQKPSRHGAVSSLSKRVSETGHNRPLQMKAYSQYKEVITSFYVKRGGARAPRKQVAIEARASTVDKGQDPTGCILCWRCGMWHGRRGMGLPAGFDTEPHFSCIIRPDCLLDGAMDSLTIVRRPKVACWRDRPFCCCSLAARLAPAPSAAVHCSCSAPAWSSVAPNEALEWDGWNAL
jgi:hypothetical protein